MALLSPDLRFRRMILSRDDSETHVSSKWRWAFLVAITVLLICSGLAVYQYTRFADAAGNVEHTQQVLRPSIAC